MRERKTAADMSPEEKAEVARKFVSGTKVAQILEEHGISATVLRTIREDGNLEQYREKRTKALIAARVEGEIKAAAEVQKSESYKSARQRLYKILDDLEDMWDEMMLNRTLKFKSVEGAANAIQKVADTIGRLTDEDQQAPKPIEITITGHDPNRPQLPATTVEVLDDVIDTPALETDCPQISDSTTSSSTSITTSRGTESSSEVGV